MAVSKRVRFEVMRRDNFTCRYCRSADNPLTVDHVKPVALGGTDDPANLVAACADCNSGKASTSPDEQTVEDVAEDALRWAAAIKLAADEALSRHDAARAYVVRFIDAWETFDKPLEDLPEDFDQTVIQWRARGLPVEMLTDAVFIAWANTNVPYRAKWRYTYGIVKNRLAEIEDRAGEIARAADGGRGVD